MAHDSGATTTAERAADGTDRADDGTSRRRRRTRERLLDAAYELFAEQGFEAASIESICERAGFTRGAFYSNFADKAELFLSLSAREERRLVAELRDAITTSGASEAVHGDGVDVAEIEHVVVRLLGALSDDRPWRLVNAEFELVALRHPEVAADYLDRQSELIDELAEAVDRLAANLGLTFVLPARQALNLFAAGYMADMRTADLSHGTDHPLRAPELAAQWLPAVIERLTVPTRSHPPR